MTNKVIAEARFKWGEDDMTGEKGFMPTAVPDGNAVTGMVAAHDVCEHAVSTMGMTLDSEIQAFGAIAFGRMVTGWTDETKYGTFHRDPKPKDLGEELAQLIWDGYMKDQRFSYCPIPTVRIERGTGQDLATLMHHCKKWFLDSDNVDPECNKIERDDVLQKLRERGLRLLRHGWARARSMYGHPHTLAGHFENVMRTVDKYLKYEECFGGEELVVRLNTRTGDIKVRIDRTYDY